MHTRGAPRRLQWLFAILFLGWTAAPVGASGGYQTFEIEGLTITIDSEWAARTAPGYLPVRFDITNHGDARVIEIVGQGSRYFRSMRASVQGGSNLRKTVRLARGDRVRLTLTAPIFGDNENFRFEVRENGRLLDQSNFTALQSRLPANNAATLIVADPASAFGKIAATWPKPVSGPSTYTVLSPAGTIVSVPSGTPVPPGARAVTGAAGTTVLPGGTVIVGRAGTPLAPGTVVAPGMSPPVPIGRTLPPIDFMLDPARLPTTWLGFTSLRAVVIGPKEWEQLNDAQKGALLTWTACGGDLMFVDGDPKSLFPAGQDAPAVGADGAGAGYFFGRIHVPTSASISESGLESVLTTAQAAAMNSEWALPANRAPDWGTITERGYRLPIPGVDGVPARAYLWILIVFSLLIGPANYWYLRRRRQQVLLVLTAPLISALFIVLLAGYVVAGEGLGVRARAVTFTRLDQARKQASTRASMSMYAAGMTPAGGLRFSDDVAVFTIGPDGNGSPARQSLDLSDAQRFSAGAIQARSPTNVESIGFRAARERLSFSREADGLSVVNGLGVTVTELLYRDGDSAYHLAGPLAPGGKGSLKTGARAALDIVPVDYRCLPTSTTSSRPNPMVRISRFSNTPRSGSQG